MQTFRTPNTGDGPAEPDVAYSAGAFGMFSMQWQDVRHSANLQGADIRSQLEFGLAPWPFIGPFGNLR